MPNPHPVTWQLAPTRFRPGQSGNPLGEHGGLWKIAKQMRRESRHGREIVEFLFAVLRDPQAATGRRLQAAEIILAYSYGKPRETIDLDGAEREATREKRLTLIASMAPEDREALAALLRRAIERQATSGRAGAAAPDPAAPPAD